MSVDSTSVTLEQWGDVFSIKEKPMKAKFYRYKRQPVPVKPIKERPTMATIKSLREELLNARANITSLKANNSRLKRLLLRLGRAFIGAREDDQGDGKAVMAEFMTYLLEEMGPELGSWIGMRWVGANFMPKYNAADAEATMKAYDAMSEKPR